MTGQTYERMGYILGCVGIVLGYICQILSVWESNLIMLANCILALNIYAYLPLILYGLFHPFSNLAHMK